MIISPPFLPSRTEAANATAGASEQAWLALAMTPPRSRAPGTRTFEGSFPVSAALQWHNGIHLVAPHDASGALPVRAIADGKVIFVNPPTPHSADPAHPQNYMPDGTPAWTDNGCVIVEHTTDIGANGDTPTQIVYFSLYMHLGRIETAVKLDGRIYRKDPIGIAGQFHGAEGQLHFETCCDKANLDRLVGREARWTETEPPTAPTADGRTDTVFGEVFVYLPKDTPISPKPPAGHMRTSSSPGAAGTTLGTAQWVGIRHDRGTAILRSIDLAGRPIGALDGRSDKDFEYDLYTEANRRNADYLNHHTPTAPPTPVPGQASPIASSPSGWYELLRFGRNLGPDPLPADAAHWREIPTATGSVWADLNAVGTFKFSEADFLAVTGWNFFDDDPTPLDMRCDSVELKRWIRDPDPANARRMEPEQLGRRLGEPAVQERLRRAVCNFSTEWDATDIEVFLGWVRDPEQGYGLEREHNWKRFVAYCRAVTFVNLPAAYLKATWRLHPGEFIAVMRRCGWLSRSELARIYESTAKDLLIRYTVPMNKVIRKYGYASCMVRLSHFLGQGAVESESLLSMQETSMEGSVVGANLYGKKINLRSKLEEATLGHWYGALPVEDDPWFRSTKYSSKGKFIASSYNWRGGNLADPDAQKFRGRGFKQLTGLSNYASYWVYRGWLLSNSFTARWWDDDSYKKRASAGMKKIPPNINDPHRANATPYNCIDTGGWYLVAERPKTIKKIDQDSCEISHSPNEIEAEKNISWEVTRAINGGEIDKDRRLIQTRFAKTVLL